MSHINEVSAMEILDSRGNPTIEVTIVLSDGAAGRAAVPSVRTLHPGLQWLLSEGSRWGQDKIGRCFGRRAPGSGLG